MASPTIPALRLLPGLPSSKGGCSAFFGGIFLGFASSASAVEKYFLRQVLEVNGCECLVSMNKVLMMAVLSEIDVKCGSLCLLVEFLLICA